MDRLPIRFQPANGCQMTFVNVHVYGFAYLQVWCCWTACDEGCTGQLLATLNVTLLKLAEFNDSASALLPWARMRRANNTAHRLRVWCQSKILKLSPLSVFTNRFFRRVVGLL